jgi:hypothetical protein
VNIVLMIRYLIYIFQNQEKKKGLYQHPIIQKVVNRCWFNNSRDEGIVYADLFDPLSVEAIALVLTAVRCFFYIFISINY